MPSRLKTFAWLCSLVCLAVCLPSLNFGATVSLRYASAMAQASATEKSAFDAAKELGTVEAWDAFLTSYPSGFYSDLARAYVKKLAGAPPAAASPAASPTPAAPPAASRLAAVGQQARELPCSDAEKIGSKNSDTPATIRFVNESGGPIVIQWIDFNGRLKEYGVVQPGAEMVQETFLTHPWIAAYMEGSCRQMFLPVEGVSIARLRPEDQIRSAPAQRATSSSSGKSTSRRDDEQDHGPTPEQTCKNIGQDYNGRECVPRRSSKSSKPSKATVERRAAANCQEIGMIYLNGKCAPKKKSERTQAKKNKNKACPAGMYRNPYGVCQPNETGS